MPMVTNDASAWICGEGHCSRFRVVLRNSLLVRLAVNKMTIVQVTNHIQSRYVLMSDACCYG